MIQVIMRKDDLTKPPQQYLYQQGAETYVQDHWLYVIDDDGLILGSHPEQNVNAVLRNGKAGENE